MKTIRKIKISLSTREISVNGLTREKTDAEPVGEVCPLCHSPLPAAHPLFSALGNLAETPETQTAPKTRGAEIKKITDGENNEK